jgi:hypothetical protein
MLRSLSELGEGDQKEMTTRFGSCESFGEVGTRKITTEIPRIKILPYEINY